ncbi:MAG: hypothetical protein ACTHZ9_11305 [Leucobacter sp.]
MSKQFKAVEQDARRQYGIKYPNGHIEWQEPGASPSFDLSSAEVRGRERNQYRLMVSGVWLDWRAEFDLKFVTRFITEAVTETEEIK